MAIRFKCACGRALKVDDSTAGKKVKCPHCGQTCTIPAAKPIESPDAVDSDFASLLGEALEMDDDGDAISADAAEQHRKHLGRFAETLVPCPHCGVNVERATPKCRHCSTSFREGPCATCGASLHQKKGKGNRTKLKGCRCRVLPVIWGKDGRSGLCANCGRTLSSGLKSGLSCPWCSIDMFLDLYEREETNRNRPVPVYDLPSPAGAASAPSRTEDGREKALRKAIRNLEERVAKAQRDAQANAPGLGGVAGGIVGGIVLVAVAGAVLGSMADGLGDGIGGDVADVPSASDTSSLASNPFFFAHSGASGNSTVPLSKVQVLEMQLSTAQDLFNRLELARSAPVEEFSLVGWIKGLFQ